MALQQWEGQQCSRPSSVLWIPQSAPAPRYACVVDKPAKFLDKWLWFDRTAQTAVQLCWAARARVWNNAAHLPAAAQSRYAQSWYALCVPSPYNNCCGSQHVIACEHIGCTLQTAKEVSHHACCCLSCCFSCFCCRSMHLSVEWTTPFTPTSALQGALVCRQQLTR